MQDACVAWVSFPEDCGYHNFLELYSLADVSAAWWHLSDIDAYHYRPGDPFHDQHLLHRIHRGTHHMANLHTDTYVTNVLRQLIEMPPEERVHATAALIKAAKTLAGMRRVTMQRLCIGKTQRQLAAEIGLSEAVVSTVMLGPKTSANDITSTWRIRLRINGEWHDDTITARTPVEAATIHADQIRIAYGTDNGTLPVTAVRIEQLDDTP